MKNHLNQAISIIIMIHVLLFFKFKDWLMLLNEGCGLKLFFVSREWQTFNKQQDIFRGRTIMSPLCAFDGNYTVLLLSPMLMFAYRAYVNQLLWFMMLLFLCLLNHLLCLLLGANTICCIWFIWGLWSHMSVSNFVQRTFYRRYK